MTKQEIIKKYPFARDLEITGCAYIRNDTVEYELIEIFERLSNTHKTLMFIYNCGYFCDLEKYNDTARHVMVDNFGVKMLDFDNVKITNY